MHNMYIKNLNGKEKAKITTYYLERIITNSVDNLLLTIPVK